MQMILVSPIWGLHVAMHVIVVVRSMEVVASMYIIPFRKKHEDRKKHVTF